MTSASNDTDVHLLRGVVPEALEEPAESPCPHDQLVFDDINDVHCDHCGKDFTG